MAWFLNAKENMTAIAYTNNTSNGGEFSVDLEKPYISAVTIEGIAPVLFHRWDCDAVEEKSKARKNSKAKKLDDVLGYVYRDEGGHLGIPGTNFHMTLAEAGRYMPDPRSPRKSSRDLVKAAIVPLNDVALFHGPIKDWDYIDRRRVTVQRNAVTRERPALRRGWRITFRLLINAPEYIDRQVLQSLIANAGRLVGICDFRPTFGRFTQVGFEVEQEDE